MTPLDAILVSALAAAALCGFLLVHFRVFRDRLVINPRYRDLLVQDGLTTPRDFLALSGVIVSGHPDRHVMQLTLGDGPTAVAAFLKREHRVPWRDRLRHGCFGFGFVSKSVREAHALRTLHGRGINCPEWIAAGEAGHGRAFLLMKSLNRGVDLRVFLRDHLGSSPGQRRRFACRLGEALAQIHDAGYDHPDLYASHVFVDPKSEAICIIDWQRSRQRSLLRWRWRCRDLTVLHATLGDDLASPRERLVCLGAYLRASLPIRIPRPFFVGAVRQTQRQAERLLRHRHIREIRRPPLETGTQNLIWLDGEALCVTREFQAELGGAPSSWLPSLVYGSDADQLVARSEVVTPAGRPAVLVRRWSSQPLAWLRAWLRGRRVASPELEGAGILFRLQRYGIVAPRLLAMGQRSLRFPWQTESFLLTEVLPGTMSLRPWLSLHPPKGLRERRHLIREAGRVLRLIHDAGCSLGRETRSDCPVQIQFRLEEPARVVISSMEGLRKHRGSADAILRREVRRLGALLRQSVSQPDQLRFFLAYLELPRLTPDAKQEASRLHRNFVGGGTARATSSMPRPTADRPLSPEKEAA